MLTGVFYELVEKVETGVRRRDTMDHIMDLDYIIDSKNKLGVSHPDPSVPFDVMRIYQYMQLLRKIFKPREYFQNIRVINAASSPKDMVFTLKSLMTGFYGKLGTPIGNIPQDMFSYFTCIDAELQKNKFQRDPLLNKILNMNVYVANDIVEGIIDRSGINEGNKTKINDCQTKLKLKEAIDNEPPGRNLNGVEHLLELIVQKCMFLAYMYGFIAPPDGADDIVFVLDNMNKLKPLADDFISKKSIESFERFHTTVLRCLCSLIFCVCKIGQDTSTFQYHFTELTREYKLLLHLWNYTRNLIDTDREKK